MGSAEATTCVVAAFRCTLSGRTALAHLDACFSGEQVEALLSGAFGPAAAMGEEEVAGGGGLPPLTAYLLGGFRDPAGQGPALARRVLAALDTSPRRFRLALCCVGEANTEGLPPSAKGAPWPRFSGLAVDPASGQAYALEGTRPGPESRAPFLARRHAALWLASMGTAASGGGARSPLLRMVFTEPGRFRLPVETHLVPRWAVARVQDLLHQSAEVVLACCSTSPEQEGPDFLPQLRAAFDFILQHALLGGAGEDLVRVHLPHEELGLAEWRAASSRSDLGASRLKAVRSAPRLTSFTAASEERDAPMAC